MNSIQRRIDQARWWALMNQPFYGALAMHLKDIISEEIPTACTDGVSITWNPSFCASLSDEELRFVLLHETCHCAHLHFYRLPANDKANVAADYVVNSTILTANPKGFGAIRGILMPKDGLICPMEYFGLAEEEIYRRLPDDPNNKKYGNACGAFSKPNPNKKGKGKGEGQDSLEELKAKWEKRIAQVGITAKLTKGTLPGDLERRLQEIQTQRIDWRQEMANFIKDTVSYRNDWSRSSRRHVLQPVIYPRRHSQDLIGLVIFHRDTSGSTSRVVPAFTAHITHSIADTRCRAVVLDGDTRIQQEVWLNPGEECPLVARGGGGTDHRHVWDRVKEIAESGEKICGIVCLTDLETSFPADDGGFPTLWISTNNRTAPFGRTVQMMM